MKNYLALLITLLFTSCKTDTHESASVNYVELLSRMPDTELPVISCEAPYEKELSFPTIITLPDKYIMYYVTFNGTGTNKLSTCYAESVDGINWVKPNLGLIEFNGNSNNNIISNDFEGVCVEYHDGVFYLITYASDFKTYLYKSIDGKKFDKVESFNIPYTCDSQNQIIWDSNTNGLKYI